MENVDIFLRCYLSEPKVKGEDPFERSFNQNLLFVFDTETKTTLDKDYQTLLFGSCSIYERFRGWELVRRIIFYPKSIRESELDILKAVAKKESIELLPVDEFIALFFMYVYKRRALCIGFNLPFDLSRIAMHIGTSKNDRTSFSLQLSDRLYHPRIFIKHISSKSSFIGFSRPLLRNKKRGDRKKYYAGAFLDLKTLAFSLTNKSFSLETACDYFKVEHKKLKAEEFGKITVDHVEYNLRDVLATYELYLALARKFHSYGLEIRINSLFSPASLAKAFLDSMNIKSFGEQNPEFRKDTLGYVMTTYFGGRSEVHIRKQHVQVSYLDFTSMYPSQFELQDLWSFVVANKINIIKDDKFHDLLDKITLSDLKNKETWKKLTGIAKVDAKDDIFPVRSGYGKENGHNIGVNHVTGQLYYTYADIIASKLLTGKTPQIIEAYRFEPVGVQNDLKKIMLFGREVDPSKESFVKVLIEHRLDIKKQLDNEKDNADLDNQQNILKIIANSIYGINVQIDTVPVDKSKHPDGKITKDVYGLRHLYARVGKNEEQGKAFNPLIATWLTSGARLILAMAEAYLEETGGYYAYMDTDGIFVDPSSVKGLQALVEGLNPYDRHIPMFKVETIKDNDVDIPLDNVTFFGISAKRYGLYTKDNVTGKIKILKCSSSAIGHICSMPRGWEMDFWIDIIRYDNGEMTDQYIEGKYGKTPVAAQVSISSPVIRNQFTRYYNATAFNFIIIGTGYRVDNVTGEPIIPMIPYTKDLSSITYIPFIDKITGKLYTNNTEFYWKPLSKLFFEYIKHEETKYEGNIGTLKRRHLHVGSVIYTGKESNNLEESEIIGVQEDDNVIYDDKVTDKNVLKQGKNSVKNKEIIRIIMQMTYKQAANIHLSKRQLLRLRKKLKNHEPIMLRKKTFNKLKRYLSE